MITRIPIESEFVLEDPFTLKLFLGDEVLFSSQKAWLHPLFELESFFAQSGVDPMRVVLSDRIIGRGAAFLVVRMGLGRLRTQVLSRLAIPILETHGVDYRYDELIERVACATESELAEVKDEEVAYVLIRKRWERTLGNR